MCFLAMSAGSSTIIKSSYIVFFTKMQKKQTFQKGSALLKITDMESGLRCQTYPRFLRWIIFSPYGWISENFSGWNEIIQDVVLAE